MRRNGHIKNSASMKCLAFIALLVFQACAIVTPVFVGVPREAKHDELIPVYFRADDVPFKYTVIYWADRSPGEQAKAIRARAAQAGADAVIIDEAHRFEGYQATSADVFQLSGLAIVEDK